MKPIPGNHTSHVLLSALNVTSSPTFSGESAKPNGLKWLQHRPHQMPWKNLPHTHWLDFTPDASDTINFDFMTSSNESPAVFHDVLNFLIPNEPFWLISGGRKEKIRLDPTKILNSQPYGLILETI